jgi:hypothetical protein
LIETTQIDSNTDNKNESNTDSKNPVDKGIGYKTFIEELKKYGGIKTAIKHQSQILMK